MCKTKCDTKKCHAACCYNVPMPKGYFSAFMKKVVTPYKRLLEQEMTDDKGQRLYIPVVDEDFHKNKCPFLRDDYKCNIYDQRPWICRAFGTPPKGNKSKFLQCGWLNGLEYDNMITEQNVDESLAELMKLMLNGEIHM